MRRALVLFLEVRGCSMLVPQFFCLYESYRHVEASRDTDLVVFGPEEVLAGLPDDVRKVPQAAASDDPAWRGYHFVNSIACLNGPGSGCLAEYSHLLRTDVDVFLTPAWNDFHPAGFVSGTGGYAGRRSVRRELVRVAREVGLRHHGVHDVGSTVYGPRALVQEHAELSTRICLHLLQKEFAAAQGEWPGWYGGVASMYASEIAANHLVGPGLSPGPLLDADSRSRAAVRKAPHVHCRHGDRMFSKHAFARGEYDAYLQAPPRLDLAVVRDYCLAMALRARRRSLGGC